MFEYSTKQSIISELSLPTKALLFVFFVFLAMLISDPVVLFPILLVCIFLCIISGMSIGGLLSSIKPILLIFVFLFIFSAFTYNTDLAIHDYAKMVFFSIYDGKSIDIGLTSGGLLFGLGFVLKMLIMMYASALLAFTSPVEDLLYGLQKIGLPYQLGLMMTIAIRFIPTLTREVEQIQQAQRARGSMLVETKGPGQTIKNTVPLFVPMIVSSIRRSDTMAMSMVSRGFGFTNQRTVLVEITLMLKDYLFAIALVIATIALLYIRNRMGLGIL